MTMAVRKRNISPLRELRSFRHVTDRTVSQIKNGDMVQNTITWTDISVYDSGNYSCEATSSFRKAANISITVYGEEK